MAEKIPEGSLTPKDIANEIEKIISNISEQTHENTNSPPVSEVGKIVDAGPFDYGEILSNAEVFLNDEFPSSDAILVSVTPTGEVPVFTPGNISFISGKPKTCKTTLAGGFMVGLHHRYASFESRLSPEQNEIIFLDCEMGGRRTQELARLVCKMLSVESLPRNIRFFSIRQFDTAMRLSLLEYMAFHSPNLAIIFLDGIRDLILDVNSNYEVSKLMEKLLNIIERTNIHLCTIIHQNKINSDVRGALGTELSNKCELALSLTKKEESGEVIYTVKTDLSRDKEFPSFAFQRTDDGIKLIEDWKPASKKSSVIVDEIPEETHKLILTEVFKQKTEHSYNDLVAAIQSAAPNFVGSIGIGKAKQLITFYYSKKLVASRRNGQQVNYSLNLG
jgi:hypothetical protein